MSNLILKFGILHLSFHSILDDKHVIDSDGQNQERNNLPTDHRESNVHVRNQTHTGKHTGQHDNYTDDG
jgi:hypothetical protein